MTSVPNPHACLPCVRSVQSAAEVVPQLVGWLADRPYLPLVLRLDDDADDDYGFVGDWQMGKKTHTVFVHTFPSNLNS